MQALILAAGRGKRLGSLTQDRPKPMVQVAGRPALVWILQGLRQAGIEKAYLVVGHQRHVIEEAIGDGSQLGMAVNYLVQEHPNGTGSAVHLAARAMAGEDLLVTFGDILISAVNYQRMVSAYNTGEWGGVLGLNWVEDPYQGAAVTIDAQGQVLEITEKPPKGTSRTNWNNAGVFCFGPELFEETAQLKPSARGEYELSDAIHALLQKGSPLFGLPLEGYWGDIGTPQSLEEMERILRGESCDS